MTGHDRHDDDALSALLRSAAPEPPFEAVDWQRLHARITAGAAPLLRDRTQSWWGLLAAWSTPAGTAVAAAAAVVFLLLGQIVRPGNAGAEEFVILEEVLAEAMLAEAAPLLSPTPDDVIDALLFEGTDPR